MIGIVIPAHNEAACLASCLAAFKRAALAEELGDEPVWCHHAPVARRATPLGARDAGRALNQFRRGPNPSRGPSPCA